jgi:hypothetical protein
VEVKDNPEPEENELEESKSLPVFLNLTDFISCKNAAILSGVMPIVGCPFRRDTWGGLIGFSLGVGRCFSEALAAAKRMLASSATAGNRRID